MNDTQFPQPGPLTELNLSDSDFSHQSIYFGWANPSGQEDTLGGGSSQEVPSDLLTEPLEISDGTDWDKYIQDVLGNIKTESLDPLAMSFLGTTPASPVPPPTPTLCEQSGRLVDQSPQQGALEIMSVVAVQPQDHRGARTEWKAELPSEESETHKRKSSQYPRQEFNEDSTTSSLALSPAEATPKRKRTYNRKKPSPCPSPSPKVKKPKMYEQDTPEAKNARAAKMNREKHKQKVANLEEENITLKAQLQMLSLRNETLQKKLWDMQSKEGLRQVVTNVGDYLVSSIRKLQETDPQAKVEIPQWFHETPIYATTQEVSTETERSGQLTSSAIECRSFPGTSTASSGNVQLKTPPEFEEY